MILFGVVALLSSVLAQPSFKRYATTVSDTAGNNVTLAVDIGNPAQMKQGRASMVVIADFTQTTSINFYPYFNGTFTLEQPTTPTSTCTFLPGVMSIFDLSDNGWLQQAQQGTLDNGDTMYWLYMPAQTIVYPQISNGYISAYTIASPNITLLVPQGAWHPSSLNVSYGNYPYPQAVFLFSDFSTHLTRVDESMWAPPNDGCIDAKLRCTGSWPIQTLDFYRSHDNSSYAHVLENANTATAAGECYFACRLSPGPYITKFRVRVSTAWNAYSECNGGSCNWSGTGMQPVTYGTSLGVGREESLGNNMGDGTGQCDTAAQDPGIGYWFSMNINGRCPFGKKVGYNNCTWEADYVPVKTITLSCSNITQNCNNVVWTAAGAALEQAFKTCPAVNALLTPMTTPYQDWLKTKSRKKARTLDD